MALVDYLNKTITEVGQAWDDAGPLRILIALIVPVAAWFVRKPLANLVFKLFSAVGKGVGFDMGDKIEESVLPAIQVFVVVLGALIAHESIQLPEPFFGVVEKLLVSICVAAVFAVAYSLCKYIPQFFEKKHTARAPEQISWVVRVAQFIVMFVGIAAVFRVWGIDIGPVLTGMGLAGAAVALAAQDYLKNLLAGFNNAAERRFREGDWIRVEGLIEGTVESVDLRSTVIRRFDKAPVYVPNSELANKLLINFSRCPHRRIYWKISLTYATSIDILRTIRERIEQYIDDSDRFVAPDLAARYVRIDSFNDSSIEMLVLCFSQSNVWADYLEAKEELALAIKSIVTEAGGNFAFPSRSVYMEASPEDEPVGVSGTGSDPHRMSEASSD
ncbi:mechanosensitive ion channel family protein [Gammaproteobacteria bacterium]|nr:mechanosensitive ion channel family protein [Gammaproteobacteria bacterium]